MDADILHQHAIDIAEKLAGSQLEYPFGPDWEVFKVCGKIFMLLTELDGESIVIIKAHPEEAHMLCDQYDDITPGYHMNKKHWITLHPGGSLSRSMIAELVTESYLLVVEKLPRAQRPVDPATYGFQDF